ncbi:MAG TPA: radical SAM protein, partial [Bacteroidia bacterium]|nr:radical SAM protein [Bacteroidia bacterium]
MFTTYFNTFAWEEVESSIYSKTKWDVEQALQREKRTLEDFKALLSPAAAPYLEEMAQLSQALTQKRFGKTIQLFAPLYVSNECNNICTYCGFSMDNKVKRKTLHENELLQEAELIKQLGFNHLLLVSGEANNSVNTNYFLKTIELLKYKFANISIEVQPLEVRDYEALQTAGAHSVLVYQETYHQEVYKKYHPKGKKSNFQYRLETPDRV